jgi:mRNA-degrading endonuclease RelE of RelBE toxin-antitoxin system
MLFPGGIAGGSQNGVSYLFGVWFSGESERRVQKREKMKSSKWGREQRMKKNHYVIICKYLTEHEAVVFTSLMQILC